MRPDLFFFAAGAVLTALGEIYKESIFWHIILYAGIAVMALSAIDAAFRKLIDEKRRHMFALIGMVIFGAAFLGCLGWYLLGANISKTNQSDRWIWSALTDQEIDSLYIKLRGKDHYSIQISCNRPECSELAASFDKLFKRLGWPSVIGDAGIFGIGVTGILIIPRDPFSETLRDAIETTTVLRPDIQAPREPKTPSLTNIIIGTKPSSMPSGPLTNGPASNVIGPVIDNKGIVTQGQKGDNKQ